MVNFQEAKNCYQLTVYRLKEIFAIKRKKKTFFFFGIKILTFRRIDEQTVIQSDS